MFVESNCNMCHYFLQSYQTITEFVGFSRDSVSDSVRFSSDSVSFFSDSLGFPATVLLFPATMLVISSDNVNVSRDSVSFSATVLMFPETVLVFPATVTNSSIYTNQGHCFPATMLVFPETVLVFPATVLAFPATVHKGKNCFFLVDFAKIMLVLHKGKKLFLFGNHNVSLSVQKHFFSGPVLVFQRNCLFCFFQKHCYVLGIPETIYIE